MFVVQLQVADKQLIHSTGVAGRQAVHLTLEKTQTTRAYSDFTIYNSDLLYDTSFTSFSIKNRANISRA